MVKKTMSDEKIKHLEFIQNVISRMNSNSFYIKGWAITMISAIMIISKDKSLSYSLSFFSIAIFWGLDAYYLNQEKKYRKLYDLVVKDSKHVKTLSMKIPVVKIKKTSFWRCLFSKTIWPIYSFMIVLILVSTLIS